MDFQGLLEKAEMEQRQNPRVRVPTVVEVFHISFGRVTTTIRDASESGMFVVMEHPALALGAKVKIRHTRVSSVDHHATPQVEAVVRRVEDNGFGVEFVSVAGAHLWSCVQRQREELQIGQDYFQVHQSVAVQDEQGRVLVVQQQGMWGLPGHFLRVGDDAAEATSVYFQQAFGLKLDIGVVLDQTTEHNAQAAEAAVFRSVFHARAMHQKATLLPGLGYRSMNWLSADRSSDDLTFASTFDQNIVRELLQDTAKAGASAA